MNDRPPLLCPYCGRRPDQIDGIRRMLLDEDGQQIWHSPDDYVWDQEGTLNRHTGHFACDDCYIAIGMPTAPHGWTVPEK